eukprot:SAG22_NODE_4_length_44774_cov_362.122149_12_plen_73_part_00
MAVRRTERSHNSAHQILFALHDIVAALPHKMVARASSQCNLCALLEAEDDTLSGGAGLQLLECSADSRGRRL